MTWMNEQKMVKIFGFGNTKVVLARPSMLPVDGTIVYIIFTCT